MILLATALYSLTPLAVHYVGAGGTPFLFNLGWRAGAALGFAAFLALCYRGLFFSRAVWAALRPRFRRREFRAVAAAYFDLVLFVMAVPVGGRGGGGDRGGVVAVVSGDGGVAVLW